MNIALVDDLPREIKRISDIIRSYSSENRVPLELKTFQNAEDFLADYRPFQYTLIFMDIYMDGMTGMEAAKKIRESDNDTLVVFLTTSADHAFEAFNVHAYHYILKGADDEELSASVRKVLSDAFSMRSAAEDKLIFSVGGEQQSLAFSNIVYAQSQKNYVQITDRRRSSFRARMTFSEVQSVLGKDSRFLQINRGILINMDYITAFSNDTCELEGGYSLPISVREQKKLDQIRKNYVFSKLHGRRTTGGRPR